MSSVHYATYSEGRAHLKELLDAAAAGRPATIQRDLARTAMIDAARLRVALVAMVPARAEVIHEDSGWSAMLPGLPIAADATTFDEAITELIDACRDYAADWVDHLLNAPNHRDNWGLVQLIALSDDAQLREWLLDAPE